MESKVDILQAYLLDILKNLRDEHPKRFKELRAIVPSDMTLTNKLEKLLSAGLIEVVPLKVGKKYANAYKISAKGSKVLRVLRN